MDYDNYKTMRTRVIKLSADNSNQSDFLVSVRPMAGALGAISFLTRGRSRYRAAKRCDLMQAVVKQEMVASSSEPSEAAGDGSWEQPIDVDELRDFESDDVEAVLMANLPIYLAVGSKTEQETTADNVVRMKLYQQLVAATPHHGHKTGTCNVGDCFGYLKLVLKDVRVTGQARYKSLMALQDVKFTAAMTISELASALKNVQTRANRLKEDAIDDDGMKGALLSLAQGHSKFERLATDFSKRSVKLSYDEIIDELQEHEANNAANAAQRPLPVAERSQATMLSDQGMTMTELAAAVIRGLGKSKAMASQEACRNYQRGKCTRDPCRFSHDTANSIASADSGKRERKQMICYNCQKLGFHTASECTAPKAPRQERRRQRDGASEQANLAGEFKGRRAWTSLPFCSRSCGKQEIKPTRITAMMSKCTC